MPIHNFEEWEQAVLQRRIEELKGEIREESERRRKSRFRIEVDWLLLREWGRRLGKFLLVGGVAWVAVDQLPERLEPLIVYVSDLVDRLRPKI